MAEEGQEKKKGSKLKLIIILLLVLLLGAAGYFAYDKFLAGGGEEPPADANATDQGSSDSGGAGEMSPEGAVIVSLDTFTVNLADPLGRRYLKITIDVELTGEDAATQLDGEGPKVKDRIITLLTSMSYADISSPEGKLLLKNEIVDRLNQILGGSKVLNVYFTEFIVQ